MILYFAFPSTVITNLELSPSACITVNVLKSPNNIKYVVPEAKRSLPYFSVEITISESRAYFSPEKVKLSTVIYFNSKICIPFVFEQILNRISVLCCRPGNHASPKPIRVFVSCPLGKQRFS